MTGMTLYEATEALHIIEELLVESGGELTPEIEELLAQAEGDFATKVERVALKVRELTGAAAIAEEEAKRLTARRRAYENAATGLKRYLESQLRAAGKTKVEGKLATVALQKNPPSLVVPPDADLGELLEAGFAYVSETVSFSVDKRGLLDAVKSGADVLPAGWAVKQDESLRIR